MASVKSPRHGRTGHEAWLRDEVALPRARLLSPQARRTFVLVGHLLRAALFNYRLVPLRFSPSALPRVFYPPGPCTSPRSFFFFLLFSPHRRPTRLPRPNDPEAQTVSRGPCRTAPAGLPRTLGDPKTRAEQSHRRLMGMCFLARRCPSSSGDESPIGGSKQIPRPLGRTPCRTIRQKQKPPSLFFPASSLHSRYPGLYMKTVSDHTASFLLRGPPPLVPTTCPRIRL